MVGGGAIKVGRGSELCCFTSECRGVAAMRYILILWAYIAALSTLLQHHERTGAGSTSPYIDQTTSTDASQHQHQSRPV